MNSSNLEEASRPQVLTPEEAEAVLRRHLERLDEPAGMKVEEVAAALGTSENRVNELLAEVRAQGIDQARSSGAKRRKSRDMCFAAFAAALLIFISVTVTAWFLRARPDAITQIYPTLGVSLSFSDGENKTIHADVDANEITQSNDLKQLIRDEVERRAEAMRRAAPYTKAYDSTLLVFASEQGDYSSPAFKMITLDIATGPTRALTTRVELPVYFGKRREIAEWVYGERVQRLELAWVSIERQARLTKRIPPVRVEEKSAKAAT